MSVNAKEKKMLQAMWADAESASGTDIPDGTYQFKVLAARFHMTEKGKPTFKTKIKVTGGDEEYVGQEFEINDNLETKENMGWFKRKLRRLNITVTDDFDDITEGNVADEMEGKVFEGQVKTKNDFMNVYVNRLIGEGAVKEKGEEAEETEKQEETSTAIEEGMDVTWGEGKLGEVIEVLEDEELARVKKEDGVVVRVKLSLLEEVKAKKGKASEEEEEVEEKPAKKKKGGEEDEDKDEEKAFELPSAEDVEDMKAGDVRKALVALDVDPSEVADARGVLHAFCTLAEDAKAKIELSEVKPLADALGVKLPKGEPIKDQLRVLAKAVGSRLG